jgi:hypothetical protein
LVWGAEGLVSVSAKTDEAKEARPDGVDRLREAGTW